MASKLVEKLSKDEFSYVLCNGHDTNGNGIEVARDKPKCKCRFEQKSKIITMEDGSKKRSYGRIFTVCRAFADTVFDSGTIEVNRCIYAIATCTISKDRRNEFDFATVELI
jgi:hypothetical protein